MRKQIRQHPWLSLWWVAFACSLLVFLPTTLNDRENGVFGNDGIVESIFAAIFFSALGGVAVVYLVGAAVMVIAGIVRLIREPLLAERRVLAYLHQAAKVVLLALIVLAFVGPWSEFTHRLVLGDSARDLPLLGFLARQAVRLVIGLLPAIAFGFLFNAIPDPPRRVGHG